MRRCSGSTHAVMNGLVLPSGWKAEAVGGEQVPHQGQVDTLRVWARGGRRASSSLQVTTQETGTVT